MKKSSLERQRINEKAFDDARDKIHEEFNREKLWYKHKLTQGLFWTDLESNLANQYVREEAWLFGIKIKDNIKFIDHCIEEDGRTPKIGFIN